MVLRMYSSAVTKYNTMSFVDNLVEFIRKPEEHTKGKTPEGLCPVCWGYQEYDQKLRKLFRDKQVDVNNRQDSYMIVQKFVVDHLDGIKLRDGEIVECTKCGRKEVET